MSLAHFYATLTNGMGGVVAKPAKIVGSITASVMNANGAMSLTIHHNIDTKRDEVKLTITPNQRTGRGVTRTLEVFDLDALHTTMDDGA